MPNSEELKAKRKGNYQNNAANHLMHGHTRGRKYSPTYSSWQSMLARCRYPDRDTEQKYAKRGIDVCDRWRSFVAFEEDMGGRPKGTTLERKDNNRGYEPGNCIWATPVQQARNRRSSRLSYPEALAIARRMLAGESAKAIAAEFGISESLPREIHKGRTWKDAHREARA